MAFFRGDAIGLSRRIAKSAKPQYFFTILASIAALNVLAFLYHSSNSAIFNAVSILTETADCSGFFRVIHWS